MARQIKEFIQIDRLSSLDDLIEELQAVRDALPADANPALLLRGCDTFGRHIAISFMRPLTAEEAECDARYAERCAHMMKRRKQEAAGRAGGHLRAVA